MTQLKKRTFVAANNVRYVSRMIEFSYSVPILLTRCKIRPIIKALVHFANNCECYKRKYVLKTLKARTQLRPTKQIVSFSFSFLSVNTVETFLRLCVLT